MTNQQEQALKYFSEHANAWNDKAECGIQDCVNIVKQRNDFVIKVIGEREDTKFVIDIGCGTGDLVCSLAKEGIDALGIDFAREMISIADKKSKELNLKKAKFECSSIFDYSLGYEKFDVISLNGFIEYISYEELYILLDLCFKALKKNGSIVISSRNRLFNIFSLNKYTQEELEDRSIMSLLTEALLVANSNDVRGLVGLSTLPLQNEGKIHSETGIHVSTRYQFTPIQLINILSEHGFDPVEVFPIHIHAVPPKFKDEFPSIHASTSNLLQSHACNNMCLIPQSSTFMIHGRRR